MMRHRAVTTVLVVLVASGCVAPQEPGAARTTYLALSSSSAGLGAGLVVGATCDIVIHKRRGMITLDGPVIGCLIAGAVAGAGASLYGGLEATKEPSTLAWVGVSVAPALIVVAVVSKLAGIK